MPKGPKDPRERAARALCALHGNIEDAIVEGKPMWQHYLKEVDVVLAAAGRDAVIVENANDNSGRT